MRRKQIYLLIAVITLVSVLTACAPVERPTPAPTLWPTPTSAPRPTPLAFEPVNALEERVTQIYEEERGSVVNVTNRSVVYDFFRGEVPEEGTGSGFVYDDAGHIITNYHVVEDADELDETPVTALQGLTVYLENKTQVGQTIQLTASREGQERLIPVVLGVRPQQR